MVVVVVDDHVIKFIGNLEEKIEVPSSTVINRDQQLDFLSGLAFSSDNSPKKVDQFVVLRDVIVIILEITGSILEL